MTLSVVTADDARHEPDSDITVTVLSGNGYQVGSASSAAVTVTDNDPEAAPKVTIAAVSSPVTEGTAARFELTRDIVGDGPLTVQVDVSETGRMLSGTPPTVVTFSTGNRKVTLSVATTDDARDEPDSEITVTVSAGTGYTVGRPSTATVTATDNDVAVTVPGAPRSLRVTADGQTALDIAWRAPGSNGGAPVTGYRIEVSNDSTSWTDLVANTGSSATSYEHTGLSAGTTRYYRVSAINSAGTGLASNVASATTETPGIPVVTIAAVSSPVTEGTAARFELTRDIVGDGPLTVQVDVSETGAMIAGSPPGSVSFPANASTVTLTVATTDDTRDESDSEITVTVSAETGYTVGRPSTATVTATDNDVAVTVPGAPRRLQVTADGQTALDIAWRAPGSNGGAPVTGYRIEVSTDDQSWTDLVANTGSSATSYEHTGLSAGTKRYYRVSAINSAGTGPASNVASATTETPAIPVVTIAAVSSPVFEGTAAAFELTRDTRGSPLTVQVDVTETGAMIAGSPPGSVSFPANASKATLTVATTDDTRDEPDSDITVTLAAGTGYTVGTASEATVKAADNDRALTVPGAPRGLSATADGETAITLSWRAPNSNGGAPVTGYRIEVSNDSTSWTDLVANTGSSATSYEHTGLSAGTTRYYRVSAINSAGAGPASAVASATTEVSELPAVPVVTIAAVSSPVTEGTAARFEVTRDTVGDGPLTVRVEVTETGAMIAGNAPSSVRFSAQQTSVTLAVATTDDAQDESDSEITVTLGTGIGYQLGANQAATVKVTDNDTAVTVPGAPRELQATSDTQTAIDLSWQAPSSTGGAAITGYRIEVSLNGTSWNNLVANTGTTVTSYTHAGLPASSRRFYRVSAINSAGTGASSNLASATTKGLDAEPMVTITRSSSPVIEGAAATFQVTRDAGTDTSLTVNLEASETGEMISGDAPSSVTFQAYQSTVTLSVATTDDAEDEPDSDITVLLLTGSGYMLGLASTATVTVADNDDTISLPGAPRALRAITNGHTAILLNWEPPATNGGAPITGYRIEVSHDGVDWQDLAADTRSAESTYADSSVAAGTTRFYRVSTINAAGTGVPSNVASATTSSQLPAVTVAALSSPVSEGTEVAFQLTRVGGAGLFLTVQVELSETGQMIGGKIPATISFGGDQDQMTLTVDTDDDDVDEPDSEITLTVRAGPGFMLGTHSSATVTVTDNDVTPPGAPNGLQAVADGHSAINLSWTPPGESGTAAITGYRIEASPDGLAWHDLVANTLDTEPSYKDTGLSAETTRSYRVSAISAVATGGTSNVATATTASSFPVESLSRAWMARFGRTVASQVTEGIGTRLGASARLQPEPNVTGLQHGRSASPGGRGESTQHQRPDQHQLMARSSFRYSAGGGGQRESPGASWTAWGRGATTTFEGAESGHALDGSVATGLAGVDYQHGRLLAGMAVSRSIGDGSFQSQDNQTATARAGEPEGSFVGVHPYVRLELTKALSAWGLLGYGRGQMSISGTSAAVSAKEDLKMTFGAFGARGSLVNTGNLGLNLKTDGFLANTGVRDPAEASTPMTVVSRVRVALEGSNNTSLGSGSVFGTSIQAGLRRDGGDAETGIGVEFGGGVRFVDPNRGISIEASARGLVSHQDKDYKEWGFGGSLTFQPGGTSEQGLSVNMRSSWGTVTSGMDRLWSQPASEWRGGGNNHVNGVFDTRMQYGIATLDQRLTMAPYASVRLGGAHRNSYRVGWQFGVMQYLDLDVEADLGRSRGEGPAMALQASLRR